MFEVHYPEKLIVFLVKQCNNDTAQAGCGNFLQVQSVSLWLDIFIIMFSFAYDYLQLKMAMFLWPYNKSFISTAGADMDLIRENVDIASEADTRSVWCMKAKQCQLPGFKMIPIFLIVRMAKDLLEVNQSTANFSCSPPLTWTGIQCYLNKLILTFSFKKNIQNTVLRTNEAYGERVMFVSSLEWTNRRLALSWLFFLPFEQPL